MYSSLTKEEQTNAKQDNEGKSKRTQKPRQTKTIQRTLKRAAHNFGSAKVQKLHANVEMQASKEGALSWKRLSDGQSVYTERGDS